MKILMTADTVGGVWSYALELAHALHRHEVDVTLATMGAPLDRSQRAAVGQMPWLSLHESSFRLEWMDDPWDDVARAGAWLLELEQRTRPDIIHLNGYAHAALPWRAPVVVVGHSCVLSWWQAVKHEAAPPEWEPYRAAVRRGLRAADMVLAPTAAMLGELERLYGPLPPAGVVPNGRAAALFPPAPKQSFVLAAGRLWDEAKNIAALDAVADTLPWPVEVAGSILHPDGGRAMPQHVRLLGPLAPAALAGRLGQAAIYALPARYEPFGLSVLEAGLAGCALVLGDIGSLREVWGDAALFVPPGDTNALRAALLHLMRDAGVRDAMAARAHVRACQFTPERMTLGYLEVYHALAGTNRASRAA